MHLKLWHADRLVAYLGSANADWKSLAQVKELGVLINGSGTAATADLGRVFEVFWRWASTGVAPASVVTFSDAYQAAVATPPWDPQARTACLCPSYLSAERVALWQVPAATRAPNPLLDGSLAALTRLDHQQPLCSTGAPPAATGVPGVGPTVTSFVSASPGGALSDGRVPDIEALLYTVRLQIDPHAGFYP